MKSSSKEFLDIRSHGFRRVGVVSPKVHLADPIANVEEYTKWIAKASKKGVELLVFPELGISGYSCGDLFLSGALQERCVEALGKLLEVSKELGMLMVVGMPVLVEGKLFNCGVGIYKGKIVGIVPKSYLPDYREFRETRWFAKAEHVTKSEIELLGQKVAMGTDVLIEYLGMNIAIDICEDLWMGVPPSTLAAMNGANVLVNLSGSNITLTKNEYRRMLVGMSSAKNIAVQLYASAGFGESTTDCAWDGDGMIADRGNILAETKRFSMEGSMAVADVDIETLEADRLRQSSFRDNAMDMRKEYRVILCEGKAVENKEYEQLLRKVSAHPFVPGDENLRKSRCGEVFMIQASSLARRLVSLPEKTRKVVIGVSGGLDSTQALLVAIKTMDLLKLPRTNVIGVTMPGMGTSDRTYKNAVKLIKSLGATFREIPISDLAEKIFEKVGHDKEIHNPTYENTQAWSRKFIELALASEEGGLVVGTGDLSELWLGWCTMYGDHISHYGVNSSVPKTLISYLVKYVAEEEYKESKAVREVLMDVLATPVSPELLPLDKGKIVQKTEEIVGPYELHDFFGYYFVRFGMRPSKIARLAFSAFEGKYEIDVIKKWLGVFLKRFFGSQYKRSVLPDGPKVGSVGPSPRDEWKMPSDLCGLDAWLSDLDKVPEELVIKKNK